MTKKTLYGAEARKAILEGIKKITAAIKVTLGPTGRNVLIARNEVIDYGVRSLPNAVSKDGWTVAKAFDLDELSERPGVLAVKEACQKTVDQAGDGTTTCAILLEAIATKGIELIDKGANPIEMKRSIDKAVEKVVAEIQKMATPIKGNLDRIRQIATVSANNDASIGDLIADAFAKIGDEGVIDIQPSKSVFTELRIAEGFKFDKGWIHHYFINVKEKQVCQFDDPYILLYDKKVTHHDQIIAAMQTAEKHNKPVVIICEDAEGEGLAFLAMNTVNGKMRCCVVKAPEYPRSNAQTQFMEDIAILTGADYFSDTAGLDIKKIKVDQFGRAQRVIISRDETIIIGGNHNKEDLENLLNELRMNLAQANNENDAAPIEKRIARLTGGIAVIEVGAATETEMNERLDRFDDAVRATKAAIAEGFVIGAGTVFLRIPKSGNEIIDSVLEIPLKQICENAGADSKEIIGKVANYKNGTGYIAASTRAIAVNGEYMGYNAKTNTIEDLSLAGIIDPVKVLRCALTNAASAATMVMTTEVVIWDAL